MTSTLMPYAYHGTTVRIIVIDGESWFVLADLCKVLDLSNPTMVAERLDADALSATEVIDSLGREQQARIVNESGMYETVFMSRKPEAKTFRRWLTSEVLPSIRKTGGYGVTMTREELLARAVLESQAALAEKDERIAALEPRAEVADKLLDADGDLSISDTAKALTRAGIKVGERRLFGSLAIKGWLYRHKGDGRWRVAQRAIETGHMSVLPTSHYHPKTGVLVLDPPQPRVTAKGLQRLLADHGSPTQGVLL